MKLNIYQYTAKNIGIDDGTRWIAAPDQASADKAAKRRKWGKCKLIFHDSIKKDLSGFQAIGCDIVITKGRQPDCPHGYDDPILCSQCQGKSALSALRDLVNVCEGVPVFQLDDGKASVKAVRLAGKFMKAINAAKAVIANSDKAVS